MDGIIHQRLQFNQTNVSAAGKIKTKLQRNFQVWRTNKEFITYHTTNIQGVWMENDDSLSLFSRQIYR